MCLYWGSMWNAKHSRRVLFVTFHAFQFIVKNICFIWLSLSVLCDIEMFQALYYVVKTDWMWHVVIVPCIVCVFNCICFGLYIPRMDGLSAVYTNTQHALASLCIAQQLFVWGIWSTRFIRTFSPFMWHRVSVARVCVSMCQAKLKKKEL